MSLVIAVDDSHLRIIPQNIILTIDEAIKQGYLKLERNKGQFKKGSIPWNKGKTGVYSEETLKAMRMTKKGRHLSPETEFKKGYTPWNKDIPRTEEEKKNIAIGTKNAMADITVRAKVSKGLVEYYETHDNPMEGKHHTEKAKSLMRNKTNKYYETHDNALKGTKRPDITGDKNPACRLESRQKIREKKLLNNPSAWTTENNPTLNPISRAKMLRNSNPSKPVKIVVNYLISKGFKQGEDRRINDGFALPKLGTGDFYVCCLFHRYEMDICFSEQKLDVEIDGDYWHNLSGAKERDKKRDEILKSKGWRVIRVPEHKVYEKLGNRL